MSRIFAAAILLSVMTATAGCHQYVKHSINVLDAETSVPVVDATVTVHHILMCGTIPFLPWPARGPGSQTRVTDEDGHVLLPIVKNWNFLRFDVSAEGFKPLRLVIEPHEGESVPPSELEEVPSAIKLERLPGVDMSKTLCLPQWQPHSRREILARRNRLDDTDAGLSPPASPR